MGSDEPFSSECIANSAKRTPNPKIKVLFLQRDPVNVQYGGGLLLWLTFLLENVLPSLRTPN